jgi:glycosyltransferase involved in cell wall biosynthesis
VAPGGAVLSGSVATRVGLDVTAVPVEPVGAGRYTIELARALAARSDVDLVALARRDDAPRWHGLCAEGSALQVIARAPSSRPARLVYGELALGRLATRVRPPLAVFHGPHYQLPAHTDLPLVATVHDLTFVEHPEWHEPSKVRVFSRALRLAASRAAVVICVSARTAEAFTAAYRPSAAVRVIPHGVDHSLFSPEPPNTVDDNAARARLGLPRRYVLHLGTIEPRKNLARLVRAFTLIAPVDPELCLVLAGRPGWGTDELEGAIASSRFADRICRIGYVESRDVPALLRGAAVVAYPSMEEGFGLPALEALACGAPLVTSADSVMADLAGSAAATVDAADVEGLADALGEAVAGGEAVATRRRLGLTVAAAHTWSASAAAHLEAYRLAATR